MTATPSAADHRVSQSESWSDAAENFRRPPADPHRQPDADRPQPDIAVFADLLDRFVTELFNG